MDLHFRKLGSGSPLIILHGLFGSGDNWQTLARRFGESFEVFIVDQRNHGRSPHSDDFSYNILAEDIRKLVDFEKLDQLKIIGHSMGGKAAMQFALNFPDKLSELVVVDIAPKKYPVHHREILDAMLNLDLSLIDSRKTADQLLEEQIPEFGVRQFILKNLFRNDEGIWDWRINLKVLNEKIEVVGEQITGPLSFEKRALFIKGEKSPYLDLDDMADIVASFPKAQLKVVQGSGHWVHAEAPEEFYNMVMNFFQH